MTKILYIRFHSQIIHTHTLYYTHAIIMEVSLNIELVDLMTQFKDLLQIIIKTEDKVNKIRRNFPLGSAKSGLLRNDANLLEDEINFLMDFLLPAKRLLSKTSNRIEKMKIVSLQENVSELKSENDVDTEDIIKTEVLETENDDDFVEDNQFDFSNHDEKSSPNKQRTLQLNLTRLSVDTLKKCKWDSRSPNSTLQIPDTQLASKSKNINEDPLKLQPSDENENMTKNTTLTTLTSDRPSTSVESQPKFRIDNSVMIRTCQICKKVYPTTWNLEIHKNTYHTPNFNKVCNLCDVEYATRWEYNKHLKNHCKIKNYTCYFCGRIFGKSSNMHRHLNTHTMEKPYFCSLCPFASYEKPYLTAHFKIHSKISPKGVPKQKRKNQKATRSTKTPVIKSIIKKTKRVKSLKNHSIAVQFAVKEQSEFSLKVPENFVAINANTSEMDNFLDESDPTEICVKFDRDDV